MGKKNKNPEPEQPVLPPVEIKAGGITHGQQEQNLSVCLQAPGYPDAVILLADAITKRASKIHLNYTRDAVGTKYEIDGMLHDLPPRDRMSGDAMLAVYKKLANLNPDERRAAQEGAFQVQFQGMEGDCTVSSQGVPTGEQASVALPSKEAKLESLDDLGMREKMRQRWQEMLSSQTGLVLITAMPKHGVTTLWDRSLNSTDRFVRDFVSFEDKASPENEVINVTPYYFDTQEGQSLLTQMPGVLLKEPDVLVAPNLANAETIDALCSQAIEEERLVIARIPAKSSYDAIARICKLKIERDKFAKALVGVINGRLMRRLCENCKQPYQPAPQLLQRLGIPAGQVQVLYREWQPPPEPMVDEKGNPIPPPVCPACAGLGYLGRIGLFQLLDVDDNLRQAIIKQPTEETLTKVARQSGNTTLQEEAILSVCQGVTTLTEIQRVLRM